MKLEDKTVIITGSGQGIGQETAELFAQYGASVVVADLNFEKAVAVSEYLRKKYQCDTLAIKVDVSNPDSVKSMIDKTIDQLFRIDILVNNAGICQGAVPFEDLDNNEWQKIINVNLMGTVNCIKEVIPIMKQQGSGKIINLCSLAGEVGGIKVAASYAATKAAISCLTKSNAKYLGPYNINVNAVAPGFIDTDMTKDFDYELGTVPLRRLGTPKDIANGILFLSSEEASYITGTTLDVNGGVFMK